MSKQAISQLCVGFVLTEKPVSGRIGGVRKFFIHLLSVILLLQFSWVAAATACMHETEPNAAHFGHHTHVHKLAKSDSSQKDGKLALDNDCAVCHLACSSAPTLEAGWAGVTSNDDVRAFVRSLHPDPKSDAPDRPRWSRLA